MKFFLIMAAATMLQLPLENNETCEQAFDRYVYYIDNKNHQPMAPTNTATSIFWYWLTKYEKPINTFISRPSDSNIR